MKLAIGRNILKEIVILPFEELEHIDNGLVKIKDNLFFDFNRLIIFNKHEKDLIVIFPKLYFNAYLEKCNINDNNVFNYKKRAFISINNSNDKIFYFKQNHVNVLNLNFDDITKPNKKLILFSKDNAEQILEFIELNKNKQFYIHCEAGISRSGAIATFINNLYGKMTIEDFNSVNNWINPNVYIYDTLVDVYNEKLDN